MLWDDGEPWELIGGRANNMSSGPGLKHHGKSMKLPRKLASFIKYKDCTRYPAPGDVSLPEHKEPDNVNSTVFTDEGKTTTGISRVWESI